MTRFKSKFLRMQVKWLYESDFLIPRFTGKSNSQKR